MKYKSSSVETSSSSESSSTQNDLYYMWKRLELKKMFTETFRIKKNVDNLRINSFVFYSALVYHKRSV